MIHYGQMEPEAVWKTEFLFNCDVLEFVSIQNEKKGNTQAFFSKMEMLLPLKYFQTQDISTILKFCSIA